MLGQDWLSATKAARRIRDGRLSARALMAECLDRITSREAAIRAFAHLDTAAALAAAEAFDRQGPRGALAGVPLGVKDLFDTADAPTEYGSPIWRGHRPRADAAAVALARAAGAVVIGKTVTTEFATFHPGPTCNPANPAHTPGGSSSGSAAAVAAGFCPIAFGTQTAGSVIRPAAFCGVVGFKPSFGTIPRAGVKPLADSLDTIGVMARTVADCALLAAAVSGRDFGDPERKPSVAPRLAFALGPAADKAAPETLALMERAREAAARAGAALADFTAPTELAQAYAAHFQVMFREAADALAWERLAHSEGLSEGLRNRLAEAVAAPAELASRGQVVFAAARRAFAMAMAEVDALVTPSASGEAPEGLASTGDPTFNHLWTALHVPSVTIPVGVGPRGLPLGIQLVGRFGTCAQTLSAAEWLRQAMA